MFGWLIRLFKKKDVAEKVSVTEEIVNEPATEPELKFSDYLEVDFEFDENRICPDCFAGYLVERNGRYGSFLGCNRFPKCRYTCSLDEIERNKAEFDTKILHNYFGIISGKVNCYDCKKPTTISGMALSRDNIKTINYPEIDLVKDTGFDIFIVPWYKIFNQLPNYLQRHILAHYPVKDSRKYKRYKDYINFCEHCKTQLGNYEVYDELSSAGQSPFYHSAKTPLLLEKIRLGGNEYEIDVDMSSMISPRVYYKHRTTVKTGRLNSNTRFEEDLQ